MSDYIPPTASQEPDLYLPDIDWVKIPGGEFRYQGKERIRLETFHMARYPITNAQYQCFVDDGGYQTEEWWQRLQRQDFAPSHRPQPNRPRTDVSWYEATAFCRWLSACLGYEVRLPTQQEWERAAAGPKGLAYPWGNKYLSGYANIDETWDKSGPWNLGQTSAVGMYPQGASVEHVQDLVGNVWEWCANKYLRPDEVQADESNEPRVLRGGAWRFHPANARAANRNNLVRPDDRLINIGFRVLSSAPIV